MSIYSDTVIPEMTGYLTPSGAVRVSSIYGTREGWKAFNSINMSVNDGWTSNNISYDAWIEYEFQEPVNIEKYRVTASPNIGLSGSMDGLKWKLQGSNNNLEYVDIHVQDTGIKGTHWNEIGKVEYEFNNDIKYKTYRIQFANNNYVYIGYIEMMTRLSKRKCLIKSSNKIHILSNNTLTYPNIQDPLSQETYEKWGMDTLKGYENEISKVAYEMDEDGEVGDGRVVRKIINKNDWKINSLEVIKWLKS